MKKSFIAKCAAAVMAFGMGTAAAAPIAGYALGNNGQTLVSFNPANFGSVTGVTIQGGVSIDAIDFRPATGELYGYSNTTNAFYIIDPLTGATTQVSTLPAGTQTRVLGIDWNPTIDKLRLVTEGNRNIVYDPATGTSTQVTDLFYGAGDPNTGEDPAVVANAYTNNFDGSTSTLQYVVDFEADTLATLANNAGELTTVAALTLGGDMFDFNANAGLDVFSMDGGNVLYALLQSFDGIGLYTINVASGELTLLGTYAGGFGILSGLAISGEIPLPAGALLFGTGLALFGSRLRKKKVA
jgi:hypothetical protein